MSAHEHPIRARWPSGRRVQPGRDAQQFLDAEAARYGADPGEIRRSVEKDEPAGRMILAILGLSREDVVPSHRPPDTPRRLLIASVVDHLLANGLTLGEACERAPRYLADPALRARDEIGYGQDVILGKGIEGKLLTAKAVAAAYRKYRSTAGSFWFDPVADDAAN